MIISVDEENAFDKIQDKECHSPHIIQYSIWKS